MTTKICRTCFEEKPISEYHAEKGKRGGKRHSCKKCTLNWQRRYRESKLYGTPLPKKNRFSYIWTDIEKSYIAGIVDGEGSVVISQNHRCLQLHLKIMMTHRPTIEWLADKLNTGVYRNERQKLNPRWSDQYGVQVCGKRAAEVLRLILPYLITKKEQAEIGVEFGKTLDHGKVYAKELVEQQRWVLKEKIRIANNNRRKILTSLGENDYDHRRD